MALARCAACEQAFDTDIFIQIRPVNPLAPRDQSPVVPLGGFAVRKAWKPGERSRDGPCVREVYGERIIDYSDALRQRFFEFSPLSTHSMTSIDQRRCPQSSFLAVESRARPKPRLPSNRTGSSQNFALASSRSTCTWAGSSRSAERAVWSLPKNRRRRPQFTRSAQAVG